jgi:hypothetical protein
MAALRQAAKQAASSRASPPAGRAPRLSEPAVTDRQGIGFGWLQNAWLLHAHLKIHRGGINAPSVASTENPRAGSLSRRRRRSSRILALAMQNTSCIHFYVYVHHPSPPPAHPCDLDFVQKVA